MFEGLFQPMHLLVIFGIALLVFGPKKLPELGKGIGEGIRGFKSAMNHQAEEKQAAPASSAAITTHDQNGTKGGSVGLWLRVMHRASAWVPGARSQADACNAGARSAGEKGL